MGINIWSSEFNKLVSSRKIFKFEKALEKTADREKMKTLRRR